jgi:hypothetical protein
MDREKGARIDQVEFELDSIKFKQCHAWVDQRDGSLKLLPSRQIFGIKIDLQKFAFWKLAENCFKQVFEIFKKKQDDLFI